jgi:hypothetical protein
MLSYSQMFQRKRVYTYDLQRGCELEKLRLQGYKWIGRVRQPFQSMVRVPTIGCLVELAVHRQIGMVPIDSPQGQKLLWRQCYF